MGGVSDADTWQGSPKERVARIDHSHRFFRRRHDELNRGSELVGFSRDPVLMEALGPVLSTCYLAVKRAEIAFCQERSPHEVALAYFTKY